MKSITVGDGSLEMLSGIKDQLLKVLANNHPIHINLEDTERFDLSFIQLLYGLEKSTMKRKIQVTISGAGIPRLEKIRSFAGLPPFTFLELDS